MCIKVLLYNIYKKLEYGFKNMVALCLTSGMGIFKNSFYLFELKNHCDKQSYIIFKNVFICIVPTIYLDH